jgi:hypothetical protein
VVIAEGDVKLTHLRRDRRCVLVVFEAIPPFRGVEVRGEGELVEGDVTAARTVGRTKAPGLPCLSAAGEEGRPERYRNGHG